MIEVEDGLRCSENKFGCRVGRLRKLVFMVSYLFYRKGAPNFITTLVSSLLRWIPNSKI